MYRLDIGIDLGPTWALNWGPPSWVAARETLSRSRAAASVSSVSRVPLDSRICFARSREQLATAGGYLSLAERFCFIDSRKR